MPDKGMLYIIGLGLGDHRDVTHRGSAAIASCDVVFLEAYTSILCVDKSALESAFGKPIELAHRETVESESDLILGPALAGKTVGFLVVGDPFGATTHTDLLLRARGAGIPTSIVHNASIMNAVGACGLQLYSFGQTVSIPFFRTAWQPDSFYDRIAFNASGGLHTLCLLGACTGAATLLALANSQISYSSFSLTLLCLPRLPPPFAYRHQGARARL
jgi:diphthine synthase